jgi:TRAP-type mannitol/chloroaromatic compound transport system permease small subunit
MNVEMTTSLADLTMMATQALALGSMLILKRSIFRFPFCFFRIYYGWDAVLSVSDL